MSISSAAENSGAAIGVGTGGLILLLSGYGSPGIWLGAIGVAAAIVVQFLAIDPTKTVRHVTENVSPQISTRG